MGHIEQPVVHVLDPLLESCEIHIQNLRRHRMSEKKQFIELNITCKNKKTKYTTEILKYKQWEQWSSTTQSTLEKYETR